MQSIHTTDWIIGAAFLASAVVGAWRGVFRETAGLAAVVFGFVAASLLKERAEPLFRHFIANPHIAASVSFLAVYAATGVFFAVVGRMML
jgi:uncharacterized membrane protein required for colicin V production